MLNDYTKEELEMLYNDINECFINLSGAQGISEVDNEAIFLGSLLFSNDFDPVECCEDIERRSLLKYWHGFYELMYHQSIKSAPLNINSKSKGVQAIVRWRLKIGK